MNNRIAKKVAKKHGWKWVKYYFQKHERWDHEEITLDIPPRWNNKKVKRWCKLMYL